MKPQKITGIVSQKRIAPGSKSDRHGVVLRTTNGDELILRRAGGNAFRDEALESLVGTTITGTGTVAGQTFILALRGF